MLTFIAIVLAALYLIIIGIYLKGWQRTPTWEVPQDFVPITQVSLLIPVRNEAGNIQKCLESILACDYPRRFLQIIVIDDHSTDATAAIVQEMINSLGSEVRLQIYSLSTLNQAKTGKKAALAYGIAQSSGTLLLTTDGDTIVQPQWLMLMVSFFERHHYKMIAAPVIFKPCRNWFEQFQALDFLGMMGITAAGITLGFQRMGNGANLAYTKAMFEEIGGFEGIDQKASGDDMFLMQKLVQRHGTESVGFLKNKSAAVYTAPQPNVQSFYAQRKRWASKSAVYPEKQVTAILAVVFFTCVLLVGSGLAWALDYNAWKVPFFILLLAKLIADRVFLSYIAAYFDEKPLMLRFLPSFVQHTIYIVVVGVGSFIGKKYVWKGRKVE